VLLGYSFGASELSSCRQNHYSLLYQYIVLLSNHLIYIVLQDFKVEVCLGRAGNAICESAMMFVGFLK
jgi:hypothetical protein